MGFPSFFADVPTIVVCDPLADFLGAADAGLIEYGYIDAVKLAGHSCPTVAGAWLMTVHALRALYGTATPQRGNVTVEFSASQDSGVTGVIASIATLLTGATGSGGFKGLGGRFGRRDLLRFGIAGQGEARFRRRDNHAAVACRIDLSGVSGDPRVGELLPRLLAGESTADDARLFGALWQDRVRRILIDHGNDPAVVLVEAI